MNEPEEKKSEENSEGLDKAVEDMKKVPKALETLLGFFTTPTEDDNDNG